MTRRLILEMGMGNSLYRRDYTTAACRAVNDALRHSSIALFKSLGIDSSEMQVRVTIAVAEPDQVDISRVARELPRGKPEVNVVQGGLDVIDPDDDIHHVIATAAIEAIVPVSPDDWQRAT